MLAGGWHHSAWQVGEMFGLPFSAMAPTVIVATFLWGGTVVLPNFFGIGNFESD
jgi:hypothetical protein